MKTGLLVYEVRGERIHFNRVLTSRFSCWNRESWNDSGSLGMECSNPQRSTELGRVHAERSKTARTGMDERENTAFFSRRSHRSGTHFYRRSQSMIYWMLRNKILTCMLVAMVASPSYFFKDHIAQPIKKGRDASIKTVGKVYKEVKRSELGRKVDGFIER